MKKIFFLLFLMVALFVSGQTEQEITPSPMLASKTDTLGVAFLNEATPTLAGKTVDKIDKIRSIKLRGNNYEMNYVNPNALRLTGYQVNYHGALMLSEAGHLPDLKLQNNTTNPADFFRTGFSFQNSVNTKLRFTNQNFIELALGQNRDNNPVPYSRQDIYNALLKVDKWEWKRFTFDLGVSGSSRTNRLTNFGASHARLFNTVLTDNLNQYPYRDLSDKSNTKELLTWFKTKYQKNKFETEASLSFNKQWDKRETGTLEFTQNLSPYSLRDEQLSDLRAGIRANYKLYIRDCNEFKFFANYSFNRNENDVERMNLQIFDGFRNAHEIMYGASYNYDHRKINLFIDLKNKHYFSNTVQNYSNFFPTVSASIDLKDFLRDLSNHKLYRLNIFKLFGSASKSLGEASLVHRNYSVFSTEMSAASALSNFYEDREILFQAKMTPEIYENYEAGLEMAFWRNRYSLTFSYFNNITRNMIAPRSNSGQFILQNIGDVRNDGFLLDMFFRPCVFRNWEFSFKINFSKMRSKVLNVANGEEKVALAGFSEAGAYFAKDEPLGVILGTTYQRTAEGAIVVDNSGVPVINTQLQRIGDPTPDFTIGFAPTFIFYGFTFSFNMEYNHGGDRWNGTKAFFESSQKAAEDYIEDASYLRLSQAFLSYKFPTKWVRRAMMREVNIGISTQNPFVVSRYKGVDPATNLFGYTTGKGLDFFNMPSVKSYQFFVNIKF